ncbi:MAG: T9SS type A sorting domain-containing protein [Saprospiraceae bacterium]
MKTRSLQFALFFFISSLCSISTSAWAQDPNCTATTLEDFYDCYGGQSTFSQHSQDAITAYIQAEDAIAAGDYAQAKGLIDQVFSLYPKGATIWGTLFRDVNGANIGTPHGYYGLLMMEEIADHHLNNTTPAEVRTVNMKVVLAGCTEGIQPTNNAELAAGTGPFVTNSLDPEIKANDYRVIKQSLDMLTKYTTALSKGGLVLEVEIMELPNLCIPMTVSTSAPFFARAAIGPFWDQLSDEVKDNTDWWWLISPSHVPEFPDFDDKSFITGGMGGDAKGGPVFIANDTWITRKPAHLGSGAYSDIERRIYLPQWMMHEFYHHLFRLYPALELEVTGHDWFDRNSWPSDFEGRFEPDYYTEALHKRLQLQDCDPLNNRLITRIDTSRRQEFTQITIDELLGEYSLDVIGNDWHEGQIIQSGSRYFWLNTAGRQWEVFPQLQDGKFTTGSDSPYPGEDFFLELAEDADGEFIPGVFALRYQGSLYNKRFNMLRTSTVVEVAMGSYTRSPTETSLHTGSILKEAGEFSWSNDAGDLWSLTPNAEEENFELNTDSPTPDETFELILIEDQCGELRTLGFKYQEDYYWREKQDALNASPTEVNPLADLLLDENFAPLAIDISTVFTDPEGEALFLFASSGDASLITTQVTNQTLTLTGGQPGIINILLTAVDTNGGVATSDFEVQVGSVNSTKEENALAQSISFFPNPTSGMLSIRGDLSNCDVSLTNFDGAIQQVQLSPKQEINLSGLPSGVYFLQVVNRATGAKAIERVVRL